MIRATETLINNTNTLTAILTILLSRRVTLIFSYDAVDLTLCMVVHGS